MTVDFGAEDLQQRRIEIDLVKLLHDPRHQGWRVGDLMPLERTRGRLTGDKGGQGEKTVGTVEQARDCRLELVKLGQVILAQT